LICLGLLAYVEAAAGQSSFGILRGFVFDAQGKGAPKAKVAITNQETGISRRVVSTEEGSYEAGYLQPGMHRLAVEGDYR
jgi:hypothetical protein